MKRYGSKIIALFLYIVMHSQVYGRPTPTRHFTEQEYDHIRIRNISGDRVHCEITWRDQNGAHTKVVTSEYIKSGETKVARASLPLHKHYSLKAYKGQGVGSGVQQNRIEDSNTTFFVIVDNYSEKKDVYKTNSWYQLDSYKDEADYYNTIKANLLKAPTLVKASDAAAQLALKKALVYGDDAIKSAEQDLANAKKENNKNRIQAAQKQLDRLKKAIDEVKKNQA